MSSALFITGGSASLRMPTLEIFGSGTFRIILSLTEGDHEEFELVAGDLLGLDRRDLADRLCAG